MAYVDSSDRLANSYSMSRRTFKCTIKIVFPPSGSDSTQQLDSVIFLWGKVYTPRFQTLSGEEFDPRSWKKLRSPHPQLGWKAECDCNKCDGAGKPHQQPRPSTPLPHKFRFIKFEVKVCELCFFLRVSVKIYPSCRAV